MLWSGLARDPKLYVLQDDIFKLFQKSSVLDSLQGKKRKGLHPIPCHTSNGGCAKRGKMNASQTSSSRDGDVDRGRQDGALLVAWMHRHKRRLSRHPANPAQFGPYQSPKRMFCSG